MKLPNFLIVGAAKSGTTSLHHYLSQHPEIYMPAKIKETFFFIKPKNILGRGPGYFGKNLIEKPEDYKGVYKMANPYQHKAIGEACVAYLYFYKNSIPNIKKYLGDPKIIIILRNPTERTFSNYLHHVRDGFEPLPFEKALEEQKIRKIRNWWWGYQLIDIGFYYNQVKAYLENFSHVKVYLYDDLKKEPLVLIKNIYSFLEGDASFIPNINIKHNISGLPRNRFFYQLFTKSSILKQIAKPITNTFLAEEKRKRLITKTLIDVQKKPQMKPEIQAYLNDLYREDILKLQDLIKRDLFMWLG